MVTSSYIAQMASMSTIPPIQLRQSSFLTTTIRTSSFLPMYTRIPTHLNVLLAILFALVRVFSRIMLFIINCCFLLRSFRMAGLLQFLITRAQRMHLLQGSLKVMPF